MGVTIIHSVVLFDGNTTYPKASVSFDSEGGKITTVSTSGSISHEQQPAGVIVIDGKGHSLLPGLIESHMHAHTLHLPAGTDELEILRSGLRCGVTTLCDMHSDPKTVKKWWAEIAAELSQAKSSGGSVTLSDLKSSLFGATIEGGWPKPIVLGQNPTDELKALVATWPNVTVDTAAEFVKTHKTDGAHYIKLMQEDCCSLALPVGAIPVATLELQTAVVKAAHTEGLPIVGHALSVDMTEIVLKSGANGLTHTFIDQPPPESIIDLYRQTGAFVIPTLTVLSSLTNELQDIRDKFVEIADRKNLLRSPLLSTLKQALGMKDPAAKLEYALETVRQFKREGIDVIAGTASAAGLQGTAIGPSLWMELLLYVQECGFTPVEALYAATALPAKRFGFDDRGLLHEGKRADLVLVKGDVTRDLQALWEGDGIIGVWKEGLKAA